MSVRLTFLLHSFPIFILFGLMHMFFFTSTLTIFITGATLALFISWLLRKLDISTQFVGVANFTVGAILMLSTNKDNHYMIFLLLMLQLACLVVENYIGNIRQSFWESASVSLICKLCVIISGGIVLSVVGLFPLTTFLLTIALTFITNLFYFTASHVFTLFTTLFSHALFKGTSEKSEVVRNNVLLEPITYENATEDTLFLYWITGIVCVSLLIWIWIRFYKSKRQPTPLTINSVSNPVLSESFPLTAASSVTHKPNAKLQRELHQLLVYAEKHKVGRSAHETLHDWLWDKQLAKKDTLSLYEKWYYGNITLQEKEEQHLLQTLRAIRNRIKRDRKKIRH